MKMTEFHEFLKRLNKLCPVATVYHFIGHEKFNSLFCDMNIGQNNFIISFNRDLSLKKIYCNTINKDLKRDYLNYDDFFNDKYIQVLLECAVVRQMISEPYYEKLNFLISRH